MNMRKTNSRILIIVLFFTACSPGSDAAENIPLWPSVSDYCEKSVDVFCPYYLRCGRMAVESVGECRTAFLETCNLKYEPHYKSLADAGYLKLSQEGLDVCAEHLESVVCAEQQNDLDGPCAAIWKGTQAVGESCGFSFAALSCEPQSKCVIDLSLCGSCKVEASAGEACDGEESCDSESSCDGTSCVALAQSGEACDDELRCVLGAFCDANICKAPAYVGVGESCDNYLYRCAYKSYCSGSACKAQALLGGACTSDTGCASGFCSLDGSCEPLYAVAMACERSAQCHAGCVDGFCAKLLSSCF